MMLQNERPQARESLGNYDLLEKLGEGGMGAVYRSRHWESGQIVAIKVVPANRARNPVAAKRFEQEFRLARQFDHPNVVRALDYCGTAPTPYLVMEYVEGETVGDKLDREHKLTEEAAVAIIVQVCRGLHQGHRQGLIHRDIKPDNILMTKEGQAKLADLGLAKDLDADMGLTGTGRGLGTPNYMAPEQFQNAKNASIRCDIYSLGATLYHMVTGRVPFDRADPVQIMMRKIRNDLPAPRQLVPELSEELDQAVMLAMQPDWMLRPASCREFVLVLLGPKFQPDAYRDLEDAATDRWYLQLSNSAGAVHKASATTEEIRQYMRQGKMKRSDLAQASRARAGPFQLLRAYLEFRDLADMPMRKASDTMESFEQVPVAPAPASLSRPAPASPVAQDVPGAPQSAGTGSGEGWTTVALATLAALAAALLAYLFVFLKK